MSNLISKDASPADKLDAILMHIAYQPAVINGLKNNVGGINIDISQAYANFHFGYFGLASYHEMNFYLNVLLEMDFLKVEGQRTYYPRESVVFLRYVALTFKGLKHIHNIQNKGVLSRKCFVAMPFDENKEARISAIKKACSHCNFEAFIVEEYNGKDTMTIDAKIIAGIKSSRFCIADFTGLNQGAYFEAGFALGRGMNVIFICEQNDFIENKKHFDVNHYPFVPYKDFPTLTKELIIQIGAFVTE